jgi:hypothetical protein
MSERPKAADQEEPKGPNLIVAYGLMVLALLIAFAVALFIVWPFYKAR